MDNTKTIPAPPPEDMHLTPKGRAKVYKRLGIPKSERITLPDPPMPLTVAGAILNLLAAVAKLETAAKAAGLLAVAVILLATTEARAVPGSICRHASECSSGEVCIADSWTSSTGHCAAIRVLP